MRIIIGIAIIALGIGLISVSPVFILNPTPVVETQVYKTPTPEIITPTVVPTDIPFESIPSILPGADYGSEPMAPVPIRKALPDFIRIPAIKLDAPIKIAEVISSQINGTFFDTWAVPDEFAAGWLPSSAVPGDNGNVVLGGHNNEFGEVFGKLEKLVVGDKIEIDAGNVPYFYSVTAIVIVKQKGITPEQQLENAKYISQTENNRLTLITCYPHWNNTHRLIIIASPVT